MKRRRRKISPKRLVRKHLPAFSLLLFLIAEVIVFPRWKFAFSLPKLIFFMSIGGMLYLVTPFLKKGGSLGSSSMLFCFFLLFSLVSNVQGLSFPLSFYGSFARLDGWMSWSVLFLIFLYFQSYGRIFEKRLPFFIALLAGLSSVYALLQRTGFDFLLWDRWDPRSGSFYGYSAGLAAVLLLLLPFLVLRSKRVSVLLIALSGIALFFTGNRAAFVGVGIEAFVFLFIHGKKWKRLLSLSILLLCLLFVLGSGRKWIDVSMGQRVEIWSKTLQLARKRPWLGYGGGSFELSFQKLKDEKMLLRDGDGVLADKPHNFFLEILYSYGFVGFFLFSTFLFSIGLRSFGAFREERDPFFLSLVGYLFFLFFHFLRISDVFLFMLLAGISSGKMHEEEGMGGEHEPRGYLAIVSVILLTFSILFYRVGASYQHAVSLREEERIRASLLALDQADRTLPFVPEILEARALEETYVKVYAPLSFPLRWEKVFLAAGVYPHRKLFFWISKAYEKAYEETHKLSFLKEATTFAQRAVFLSPAFASGRIQLAKMLFLFYKETGRANLLVDAQGILQQPMPAAFRKYQEQLGGAIADALQK